MSPPRLTPQRLALAILAALAILITAQTTAYAAPTPTPKASPAAARTAEPRTDPRYYYYVQYQEVVARNPWLGAYVDGTVRSMSGRMACGYDENYQTAPCWARHENGVATTDHAIRFPLGERYLTWIRQGSYPVGSAVTDSFCGLAQGGCGVHTTRRVGLLVPGLRHPLGPRRHQGPVVGHRLGERLPRLSRQRRVLRPAEQRLRESLPGRLDLLGRRHRRLGGTRAVPPDLVRKRLGERLARLPHRPRGALG